MSNYKADKDKMADQQITFLSWCQTYSKIQLSNLTEEEMEFEWKKLTDSIVDYLNKSDQPDLCYLISAVIVWFNVTLTSKAIAADNLELLFYDPTMMNLLNLGQKT